MNSKAYKSGDILQATYRELTKGFHPIIFLYSRSKYDFIGAMITHHSDEIRNIKMEASHFESRYEISFDNSYLVKGRFIKPEEWGPFYKIGQLTEIGLEFVKKEVAEQPEETFARYFARHSK